MILAGYDPDEMMIDDWCDVAWGYILEQTPMMANPHEYRQTLWAILHDGETPPPKTPQPTSRGPRKALPRARTGMTRRDKANLDDFMKQIDAIKTKQMGPAEPPVAS